MSEDRPKRMDALAAAFRAADERMRGLPIHNPALAVEIVEAREWEGDTLAILITPWCLSLLLLPRVRGDGAAAPGTQREIELPCGACTFLAGDGSLAEPHWASSLLSPVLDLGTQETARAIAARIMAEVMTPPAAEGDRALEREVSRRALFGRRAPAL